MSDDDFLSRWSQRKRKVAEEEAAETAKAEPETEAEEEQGEKTDSEILEEFGLRDPDEMKEGDDFSVFMKAALPARIRNRALRRLWASNPAFNVLDGLDDYADDYRAAAAASVDVKTVYQVGKGMIRDLLATESDDTGNIATDAQETSAGSDDPLAVASETGDGQDPEIAGSDDPNQPEVESNIQGVEPQVESEQPLKTGRRMRFTYENDG
jgi:Protein of unknown function (DUF3306)